MELGDIKVPKGVLEKELVAVVKSIYPKYDKALHSKAKRSHLYGVTLRSDAMQAVCNKLGIAPEAETPRTSQKPRKPENRTFPCRISCRIAEDEYRQLQQHIKDDGFDTMQDWLVRYVRLYIKRKNATTHIQNKEAD